MKMRGERGLERLDSTQSVVLVLRKETLKATRDRYLHALHFQTAESKRNRSSSGDGGHATGALGSSLQSMQLPKIREQKTPPEVQEQNKGSSSHLLSLSPKLIPWIIYLQSRSNLLRDL
jgi:hypothetical protein